MQNEKKDFKENFMKRLIKFSIDTLSYTEKLRTKHAFWPVADQLTRSATSIGANIFEARASSSKRDYTNFFQIALKSSNETLYWLSVLKESMPNLERETDTLYREADELARIIGSSVVTLKGKRDI